MVKKQIQSNYSALEKVLVWAGLGLIIIGIIANTFGAITNIRFVSDVLDAMYYFRYDLLLIGGFVIGYFFTSKGTADAKRLSGVVYATFAIVLFEFVDLLRFAFQNLTDTLAFPWSKLSFDGESVLSLIILIVIAFVLRYKLRRPMVNMFIKVFLVASFIVFQAAMIIEGIYYAIENNASYGPTVPIVIVIANYLTAPLVILVITYVVLRRVKKVLDRIFFAVLIASFYDILTSVLWEFRIDPSSNATDIFGNVVGIIGVIFVIILLWRARRATKQFSS